MLRKIAGAMLVLALVASPVFVSGCTLTGARAGGAGETPKVNPSPPPDQMVKLTLYFADSQAQYVVPEVREVPRGNAPLPDLVIQELIKGPTTPGLGITIPREARLVSSVKVEKGVAYVNFNKEFQTKHWGGSAGEMMTVFSIVNSLTELEGVRAVVFLVEGERLETLGHLDLTRPVERWQDLIGK
ncbi:MAG: GerMN domain-containing protein [Bacillota bacterium]|nr:GerMN domain-containing protein [Bacillota bacterium]